MFGHDDKNDKKQDEEPAAVHEEHVVQPISTTPPDENLVGLSSVADEPAAPVSNDNDDSSDDGDINKIVDEINASADEPEPVAEEPEEESETPEVSVSEAPSDSNNVPPELLEVKKSALKELSPLLDELDQAPEEKLNILMMTIQASDDQSLIPNAFEMAKKIEDKKLRAEAMLDIINEINYFTKKN